MSIGIQISKCALAVEAKSKAASSSSNRNNDDDDENPTTRFVARLLNWFVQGLAAKNKVVRYRCVQIVGEMISHLGEIEYVRSPALCYSPIYEFSLS